MKYIDNIVVGYSYEWVPKININNNMEDIKMFPILKTKKEIEELKENGLVEGKDFIIGCNYGVFNYMWEKEKITEERYEVSFPGVLT